MRKLKTTLHVPGCEYMGYRRAQMPIHSNSRLYSFNTDVWYLSQINLLEEVPMEDLQMIDAMALMSAITKRKKNTDY